MDAETLIQQFSQEMSRSFGQNLRSVVLCGSYVHGDNTEDSDMDVYCFFERLSVEDFLCACLSEELTSRQQSRLQSYTQQAKFPSQKTLQEFDFSSILILPLFGCQGTPNWSTFITVTELRKLLAS